MAPGSHGEAVEALARAVTPDRHCPRLGFGRAEPLCPLLWLTPTFLQLASPSGPSWRSLARAPSSEASDGAFQCAFSGPSAPLQWNRGDNTFGEKNGGPWREAGGLPGRP